MTFTIRSLAAEDHQKWQDLWLGYLEFYESRVPDEVTQLTWQRLLTPNEDPQGRCAVDEEGELIGIVHFLFHRSSWTVGDYCYLQDLFVSAAARKQGVGAALIASVKEEAKDKGASQVYWLTQQKNANARRLYDQVGELTPFIKYKALW